MADKKYDFKQHVEEFNAVLREDRSKYLKDLAEKVGSPYYYTRSRMYALLKKKYFSNVNTINQKVHSKKEKIKIEPIIELTSEEKIIKDKTIIREKIGRKEAEEKYNSLLKENSLLEEKLEFLLNIRQAHEEELVTIIPVVKDSSENIATPVILLSDWHFEETVEATTINNINHYNLEIAQKRWFNCIQNSLWLVNNDRNHSKIDNLVLWLGGDFITGHIHKELLESNALSPTHATRFAKKNIIAAINFYLQYGKFKNIYVVCNQGNHGRDTDKIRVSTNYKHSYEWMMYHDISDYFTEKGEDRVHFRIPNGFFNYFEIYGFSCRFFHGDVIKYQGGIGGLTIPLIKAIHRMNAQMKADYNFMGHFHQLFQATKDCVVNGSGIGYNAYAQYIGAVPEPPMQSYNLIDQKRGLTIKAPIFCE